MRMFYAFKKAIKQDFQYNNNNNNSNIFFWNVNTLVPVLLHIKNYNKKFA